LYEEFDMFKIISKIQKLQPKEGDETEKGDKKEGGDKKEEGKKKEADTEVADIFTDSQTVGLIKVNQIVDMDMDDEQRAQMNRIVDIELFPQKRAGPSVMES